MSFTYNKKGAHIILVDDDHDTQILVSLMLRQAGYDVTLASDGVEATKRISEAIPDLIIADLMMPNLDGMGLLNHLRENPATEAVPVIVLTAKGATGDIVSGLDLGADDYISKPFEMKELLARVRSKIERPPVPTNQLAHDIQTGFLSQSHFADEAKREISRAARGGAAGCLAYLSFAELEHLRDRLGLRVEAEIAKQVANLMVENARPLDIIGRDQEGFFALLLAETNPERGRRWLKSLAQRIMSHTFTAAHMHLHLTPVIGYACFPETDSFEKLRDQAVAALDHSALQLDLVPKLYDPKMEPHDKHLASKWPLDFRKFFGTPFQVLLTMLIGLVIPYYVYSWFGSIGHDIAFFVYIIIVAALLVTAFLIWVEGYIALELVSPPETPGVPYPPASAIIAAYLPNEAATIVETIEAFLQIDYPAPLQIILAYNAPTDLPIEEILREIAKQEPRFTLLRVEGSTSKAQNVNMALAEVRGEFVGVFDADHHPSPLNFMRAWRWLSNGYDVVQGHCLVRNGDDTWVTRLIAVEFEAIYSVSHPGRARLYDFGIFGGSNGYWKTELLRRTRLHGFMLTEDIDSSIRVIEGGHKIAVDPILISRELAPHTLTALWRQRMRWAQGWYQVSLKHLWDTLRSPHLSLRQKSGLFWLLGWREIYPWLSIQIFPLIAYWSVKYGGLNELNWLIPIFVLTTLFTFSVAPGQTLFAYLLGAPEIRKHKKWFWVYLIVSIFFYTEFKNTIGRVAQLKEIMGERQWRITPRVNTKSEGAK
jgi:DNA-binding response OmpR family regulator/cellulose synthase/poly-beta-1,6-N-acetylglucosamine synthase-like glycosyltransferase